MVYYVIEHIKDNDLLFSLEHHAFTLQDDTIIEFKPLSIDGEDALTVDIQYPKTSNKPVYDTFVMGGVQSYLEKGELGGVWVIM